MSSRHPDDEPLPRAWLEAWHDDPVDAGDVRRAYLRFLRQRRPAHMRATALQVSRWILVGAALGIGSVYAATGPLRLFDRPTELVLLRAPKPVPSARPRQPASSTARSVDSAAVVVPQPPLPTTSGAPTSPPPATSTSEQWQRAARGLRERDFETANAALDELARRGSSAERESAQLVQAQLLLSQGRRSEAEQLLHALRAAAHSPLVRQKSAALLDNVDETRPSQRSFAPAEGTNDP